MDELIVFIIRETGWSLEYTTNLIKTLPIKKLNTLVGELQYQKALEDYRMAANFALIVATMASSKKRKYKVTDIIGHPPKRKDEPDKFKQAVEKAGIKIPEG